MTPADGAFRRPSPSAHVKRLSWNGWAHLAGEWNPGDSQRRVRLRPEYILSFPYVFSAVTLIVNDVGKMELRLMKDGPDGKTPVATGGPAVRSILSILRKPNRLQIRKAFVESWVASLILNGEAFILIERNPSTDLPAALHVLDPWRVAKKMTSDGRVFYDLSSDNIAGIPPRTSVPASEIIHHVYNALLHQLCGFSPLEAVSRAVDHGIAMQESQSQFFANGAQPGGVLTSEQEIGEAEAERLSDEWDAAFSGDNAGRVAVLGYGLKYEQIMMTARDAQVEAQFAVTANMISSATHVPLWKLVGSEPPQGFKPAELNQIYYGDCLQTIIEGIEGHLDIALGPPDAHYFEFRTADLMRMDEKSRMETLAAGVDAKILAMNDARRELGLSPQPGGDQPWMQMQDFPIELLLEMQRRLAAQEGGANDDETGDETERAVSSAMRWLA